LYFRGTNNFFLFSNTEVEKERGKEERPWEAMIGL
jgi:hypothetical protein